MHRSVRSLAFVMKLLETVGAYLLIFCGTCIYLKMRVCICVSAMHVNYVHLCVLFGLLSFCLLVIRLRYPTPLLLF